MKSRYCDYSYLGELEEELFGFSYCNLQAVASLSGETILSESGRDPGVLKTRLREVVGRVNTFLGIKIDLGSLNVRWIRPFYRLWTDRGRPVVQEITGYYSPERDEIGISDGLEGADLDRTLGHEVVHHAQKLRGGIRRAFKRYCRDMANRFVEGLCTYVTDTIFGDSGAYPDEKLLGRRAVERYGIRRALEGRCD